MGLISRLKNIIKRGKGRGKGRKRFEEEEKEETERWKYIDYSKAAARNGTRRPRVIRTMVGDHKAGQGEIYTKALQNYYRRKGVPMSVKREHPNYRSIDDFRVFSKIKLKERYADIPSAFKPRKPAEEKEW